MFADSFGANLAIFLLGQIVAWVYLRTGLVSRGVALLVATWVFADVALVLRFAYAYEGKWFVASLAAMQAATAFEAIRLAFGGLRRRSPAFRARREESYRAAFVMFLRDELDPAVASLRSIVRADPWDLQSRLTLGVALGLQGRRRAARRQLAGARRLDRAGRYGDAIEVELRRAAARRT